jgi:hypothetical protein
MRRQKMSNLDEYLEKKAKLSILTALYMSIPIEQREMIGKLMGIYLFMFVPIIIIPAGLALYKFFSSGGIFGASCWHAQPSPDFVYAKIPSN